MGKGPAALQPLATTCPRLRKADKLAGVINSPAKKLFLCVAGILVIWSWPLGTLSEWRVTFLIELVFLMEEL